LCRAFDPASFEARRPTPMGAKSAPSRWSSK
jgi:hypothetical protein